MIWSLAVVVATFDSARLCRAQDQKLELTGDYSYFRFNPGLPSLFNSQNLNGGGVDIAVSERIAIRLVDADYELTRFGNNFTNGNNSQSNFRFQTGIQVRF